MRQRGLFSNYLWYSYGIASNVYFKRVNIQYHIAECYCLKTQKNRKVSHLDKFCGLSKIQRRKKKVLEMIPKV